MTTDTTTATPAAGEGLLRSEMNAIDYGVVTGARMLEIISENVLEEAANLAIGQVVFHANALSEHWERGDGSPRPVASLDSRRPRADPFRRSRVGLEERGDSRRPLGARARDPGEGKRMKSTDIRHVP